MTSRRRSLPSRIDCRFQSKAGQIVLDQLRTVDTKRLVKKLGHLDQRTIAKVLRCLAAMFAP